MRELRTEIEIAAPVAQVWSILTDFNRWNPTVNQANGLASPGSKLSITMRSEGAKGAMKYQPVLTSVEQPKYLRWRAVMMAGFLFTNDKILELEESGTGTRLVHKECFSGLLVPMFWSKMSQGCLRMLNSMNDALKITAEKRSA